MTYRRNDEAKERLAERRRREDEAPRLLAVLPSLKELHFEVDETRGGEVLSGTVYTRRVVLTHAPALFFIPCGDKACKDGGHDITSMIMRSLNEGHTRFEGEHSCSGDLPASRCARVLRFRGFAKFE